MATAKRSFMKLDETPQEIAWPETHYAFIEKIGPFRKPRHKPGKPSTN